MKTKKSKNSKKREAQKINKQILQQHDIKEIEDKRKEIDSTEEYIHKNIDMKDLKGEEFFKALKESGIDAGKDSFEDFERMLGSNEAIRELVDIKNIKLKTNVSDEQHKIIVMLYGSYKTLLERYNIDFKGLSVILSEFIELSPSIQGKRAEQYVEAHKSIAQQLANAKNNDNAIRGNEMKE
jgi:hypothetical protein